MAKGRTVKFAAGAMVVQVVHSSHRGSKVVEILGSAHNEEALGALKAAARRGSGRAGLRLSVTQAAALDGRLEIVSSRLRYLWDALVAGYETSTLDTSRATIGLGTATPAATTRSPGWATTRSSTGSRAAASRG